jgi:hypothetical protein
VSRRARFEPTTRDARIPVKITMIINTTALQTTSTTIKKIEQAINTIENNNTTFINKTNQLELQKNNNNKHLNKTHATANYNKIKNKNKNKNNTNNQ